MMPTRRSWLILTLFLGACGDPATNIATQSQALVSSNGTTFNGTSLSGLSLKSVTYTTSNLAGLYTLSGSTLLSGVDPYAGIGPNGGSYDGTLVQSTEGAQLEDGVSGFNLIGAFLAAELEGATPVELQIEDVSLGTGANADLLYYRVSVERDGATPAPLCPPRADGSPRRAVAVPGVWDTRDGVFGGGGWSQPEGKFTFACEDSSIAKCVEMGYRPNVLGALGLPTPMLACVRMLRADYCGDGHSWTTNGRMIEVWDGLGINTRTEPTWITEAGWSALGAVCFDQARLQFPTSSPNVLCTSVLSYISCSGLSPVLMSSFQPEVQTPPSGTTSRTSKKKR